MDLMTSTRSKKTTLSISKMDKDDLQQLLMDIPELGDILLRVSVPAAGKRGSKRKAEKEADGATRLKKSEVNPQVNFLAFIKEFIERPIMDYYARVENGTTHPSVDELRNIMPWEKQNQIMNQLKQIKKMSDFDKNEVGEMLTVIYRDFHTLRVSNVDRQILLLAGQMQEAAILNAFIEHMVVRPKVKLSTLAEIYSNFGYSKSKASRLLGILELIKDFNLLLYTGCPITLLDQHRTRIRDLCETDPRFKMLLTGQSVKDKSQRFAFGGKMHSYTQNAMQHRSDAIKKIEETEENDNSISSKFVDKMLASNPEIESAFVKSWGEFNKKQPEKQEEKKQPGKQTEKQPNKEQPATEKPVTRKPRRRATPKKPEATKNKETNNEGNKNEGSENLNDTEMTYGDGAQSGTLTDTQLANKKMNIEDLEVDPKMQQRIVRIPEGEFSGSGHDEDSIGEIDIDDEGSESVEKSDYEGEKK